MKVLIPVSISRLQLKKSWYQSWYQGCNSKSLDTSLDIKTRFSKVSIPVSISRLNFQKSWFQSQYQDSNFKSLDSILISRLNYQKSPFQSRYPDLTLEFPTFCSNLETISANLKLLENVTPPMCKMLLFGKMIVTIELMLPFDAQ